LTQVDNAGYWKNHTTEIIVNSITINDSVTLTDEAIKQVPASIKAYNAYQSQENRIAVVRELIDPECPEHDQWVSDAVEAQIKSEDELCYEFSKRFMAEKSADEDLSWMPSEEDIISAEADMPE